MLQVATLASSSTGNCTVVSDGNTHILIDAGISARRIVAGLEPLGLVPRDFSAILITHEHKDHITGLRMLKKRKLMHMHLYSTQETIDPLCNRVMEMEGLIKPIEIGKPFSLGSLEICSFPTLHDSACSVGYTVSDKEGKKMALVTDLGMVTEAVEQGVQGAQLLICEANYDQDTLQNGPYPSFLKERILSDQGHLSNEMSGALALHAARTGAKRVILGHLSQENNSPEMAYNTVAYILNSGGIQVGTDVELSIAHPSECSGWIAV